MLGEYRKIRDEAVSKKKEEQMNLASEYISGKSAMYFASSQLKGMGTQTVSQMYATGNTTQMGATYNTQQFENTGYMSQQSVDA